MSSFQTRAADVVDAPAIQQLLPRLADFPSPARLTTEDVWRYDGVAVAEWAAGDRPQTWVRVAVDQTEQIVGVAVASMIEDSFTGQSAVHLEVVVIDSTADGHGLGQQLMAEIEADGRERGARVMSLNVMVANERARSLYERQGFEEEMIRASKPLA
jgi:ribosomal protein S18 acetylase RimI-like enzyme